MRGISRDVRGGKCKRPEAARPAEPLQLLNTNSSSADPVTSMKTLPIPNVHFSERLHASEYRQAHNVPCEIGLEKIEQQFDVIHLLLLFAP